MSPGTALLLGAMREHRPALARLAAWSAVEAVPALVSGLLLAAATDHFIAGRLWTGLGALGLLLTASLVGVTATRRLFPYLTAIVEPVRDALLTAAVTGAVASAARAGTGDASAVARLTGQVQSVRNLLFALLRTVRQIAFTVLAALVGLALLAPLAAAISAAAVALALGLFALVLPGLARRHRAVLLAGEDVAAEAGTVLHGARDVIAGGATDRAARDVDVRVHAEARLTRVLARVFASRHLLVFLGGQLPVVAVLAASPWLLRDGRLSPGEVVGAVAYLSVSLEPALRGVIGLLGGWGLDLYVNLTRLGETFAPEAAPSQEDGPAVRAATGGLSARGLTFAYGERAAPVVDGLDLDVGEGGHLAIVGASGIGKSTLADLLCGLLTPRRGRVLLAGRDLRTIPDAVLRRTIALIPQEAYVFTGTLAENIGQLAPGADETALRRAAEAVGLGALLDRADGLSTRVGTGGLELSAGERQLVALARVHASPARIVILDEATCHLDPRAEERAENAFAERPGALVVIAHRISSARRADRVLLLDGTRAHVGTDAELGANCPPYATLTGFWDEGAGITPVRSTSGR
ncbi:ATP-binding cassette domain-containing protein [Phytomonospora endophytica]|uniref:ATP-binding cassette subfamily C protein n=1 Tax=Phytomonospora endophytica TaxID=714109 RepID=A0A841FDN4_9ACTN|nr:ABC transporter ATP-binding protein [Phytomonospora endophytica]MBB6033575.1 ATP-binding cassette subfamily C protein [Phytomonospora endophytica]GIG64909.1 ABC transporter ATP-binding protein [Phytomonospora endophytica]